MSQFHPASARSAPHEDPKGNRLLAALSDADWQRWAPRLECVDLTRGQVLYEPSRPQRHAYFPTTAVVSLQCTLASGASAGIAIVGNEGVVGMSLCLGAGTATHGSAGLISGKAYRIGAQAIQDEFGQSVALRGVLLPYVQALATQIAQTAICNRHHTIEQRLCGFLLHSLDRLQGGEVVVTQEVIAGMLGARRESVTAAAGHLQQAGLIHYARGHIAVHDRGGLERRSCECHAVVMKEYDRLLPQQPHARPAEPGRRTSPAPSEAAQVRRRPQHAIEAMSEP